MTEQNSLWIRRQGEGGCKEEEYSGTPLIKISHMSMEVELCAASDDLPIYLKTCHSTCKQDDHLIKERSRYVCTLACADHTLEGTSSSKCREVTAPAFR